MSLKGRNQRFAIQRGVPAEVSASEGWSCEQCKALNGSTAKECYRCRSPPPVEVESEDPGGPTMEIYDLVLDEGMVVLDCVHRIQHDQAADMAVRWNCKAGKCGSCSAEINGRPRLMCMTRMSDVVDEIEEGGMVEIRPMKAFPLVKDLVTDVSWNYEVNQRVAPINGPEDMDWSFNQMEADRVQEFRECIECFLCQNTCHVLRDHQMFDSFGGPRTLVRLAQYEMHPLDTEDRIPAIKKEFGVEYCNITRCCTEVCPAGIQITDDAIIPLKERMTDRYYDPIKRIWRAITGARS